MQKNVQLRKENTAGARVRTNILRATNYLGRRIWKKLSDNYRRSLLETKIRCIKLLGGVMAWNFDRQVAEVQEACSDLKSLHATGYANDGKSGINSSGVRGRLAAI